MNGLPHPGLEACLRHIVAYGQEMSRLDLTSVPERQRAREKAQKLLGVAALYRQMLDALEQREPHPCRRAA